MEKKMNPANAIQFAFSNSRILFIALFVSSTLALSSCSDSDNPVSVPASGGPVGEPGGGTDSVEPIADPNDVVPPPSTDSMADFLLLNDDYGTLLRLIEDADLTQALQGDNSGMGWTLFAPPDSAFVNDEFESMTPGQRVSFIKLHLYSGTLPYFELMPGALPMTEGSVEVVIDQDGKVSVGGSTIVARDRGVSNGIIHFVSSSLVSLP